MARAGVGLWLLAGTVLIAAPCAAAQRGAAFVENRGQWGKSLQFVALGGRLSAGFEKHALVLALSGQDASSKRGSATVRLIFEGAREGSTLKGEGRRPGVYSFFKGNDRAKWQSGVASYTSVLYQGIYDGVDVRVREGMEGPLEYDVCLAPHAKVKDVVIRCGGIEKLTVAPDGALVLRTSVGEIRQAPPRTWLELPSGAGEPVACAYRLLGGARFGFEVSEANRRSPLVIDPVLQYSTYLGGARSDDDVWAVQLDSFGEVIVAGFTGSSDFPIAGDNVLQMAFGGGLYDAFVARFDPTLSELKVCTFLGGKGDDKALALVLDSDGNLLVGGQTGSSDFPVRSDTALQPKFGDGIYDAFVAKLNGDLTSLLYSTFLGGSDEDSLTSMVTDQEGALIVAGYTLSNDFPIVPGAFQKARKGPSDVFVCRCDLRLAPREQLLYSTYLGGTGEEMRAGWLWPEHPIHIATPNLVLGESGSVVLFGITDSRDFPVGPVPGAFQRENAGTLDSFIVRLVPDPHRAPADQLLYSTYLGGENEDHPTAAAVDREGTIVLTGYTMSERFPVTEGAYDVEFSAGETFKLDGFVALFRLDPALGIDQLLYSTFLGATGDDAAFAVAVDQSGAVTVGGATRSRDFEVTAEALACGSRNMAEAFVCRLDPDSDLPREHQMLYSTLLCGSGPYWEGVYALALDGPYGIVAAGSSDSKDFPISPGAFQTIHRGGASLFPDDAFVTRLDLGFLATVFRRGDVNADATINVADPIALLGHLFGKQPPPGCPDAADANDDEKLNIADAIAILGYLFGKAGSLPAPFSGCGPDPTAGAEPLDCPRFGPCRPHEKG